MRSYFPRLVGNDDTRERIGRSIEGSAVPHAFLIGGPSGSGKTVLATEIAAAMNCERRDDVTSPLPCGKCNCCRRIYEGNFPDVKTLAKKKDKATLGVEPVKEFREDMFLSSTESEYKIYIIDDAESMTPEAQNALLKVLEEPPRSVIILLLAKECDRILTTIKSRAQYISMSRFDDETIAEWLLNESPEARTLRATDKARFSGLIMSSDGRLGLASKLISKRLLDESESERGEIVELLRALSQKASYAAIHAAISRFSTKRAELSLTLERLMNALRDLLVIKYDRSVKTVFFSSGDEATAMCGDLPRKRLVGIYDAVSEAHELCARNANVTNLIASLTSNLKQAASN